ncbi:hypothetical protein KSP40_PGU017100 [Platanthera guangdongensis]|uniref:Uncharacterized protein n=1 Tax=Platanthera guangdongensis TaxID=2320717 RepID=A0ABR2M5H8_9ASPA
MISGWRRKRKEERRKPLAPPPLQATEPVIIAPLPSFPTPQLTIKEKKELASYAHSLGKKLKSQQIGKSGVTSSVAAAMVESLQRRCVSQMKHLTGVQNQGDAEENFNTDKLRLMKHVPIM